MLVSKLSALQHCPWEFFYHILFFLICLSVFSLPTPLALIYGFPKYPLPVWILSPLSLMVILQQHGGVINLSNSVWGGGKHRYFTGNQCSTLRIRWTVNSSEAIFSSLFKHITILDKEIHVEFLKKKKSHLLLFLWCSPSNAVIYAFFVRTLARSNSFPNKANLTQRQNLMDAFFFKNNEFPNALKLTQCSYEAWFWSLKTITVTLTVSIKCQQWTIKHLLCQDDSGQWS